MMHLSLWFFTILFICVPAGADVWRHEKTWGPEEEIEYRQWVSRRGFNKTIFSDPASPYYGVPTDCADVIYASRIIYAFENRLKFKIINPDPDRNFFTRYLTNRTHKFDEVQEGVERVKAFITYVGKMSGTNKLSEEDSYSVDIKEVEPGDFYITQQKLPSGTQIRHAYLIQKVYKTGVFDLIYSTLPYKVRELKKHRGLPLFSFSGQPFGFRRFKPTYLRNTPVEEMPGYSVEQYKLLAKYGEHQILARLSRLFKSEEEGLQGRASRLVHNICLALNDRIEVIEDARRFVEAEQRCVNKAEYHNYSTPVKDSRIQKQISQLGQFWRAVHQQNRLGEFDLELIAGLNELFNMNDYERGAGDSLCEEFPMVPITVKDFYLGYEAGTISAHPNDSVEARWGLADHQNNCQRFY